MALHVPCGQTGTRLHGHGQYAGAVQRGVDGMGRDGCLRCGRLRVLHAGAGFGTREIQHRLQRLHLHHHQVRRRLCRRACARHDDGQRLPEVVQGVRGQQRHGQAMRFDRQQRIGGRHGPLHDSQRFGRQHRHQART